MANYRQEQDIKSENRYIRYASRLPEFYDRFCSTAVRSTSRAIYAYNAYEFFKYMVTSNPSLMRCDTVDESIKKITLEDLEKVTQLDAAEYLKYLQKKYAVATQNAKLNAISTFYLNLYQLGQIEKSPFLKIRRPKMPKKDTVVHMAKEETDDFLNVIKNGTNLTKREKSHHDSIRDTAIFITFLDTGIRISELVGIDVADLDFYDHSIGIIRKGRTEDRVFMSDRVEKCIKEYMEQRDLKLKAARMTSTALFLNDKLERLSVRAVQRLTKRYRELANIHKQITPHRLRATFAMDFLEETEDLLLLQNAMGHANPSTTEIYAKASKQRQKAARNFRGV